MKKVALVFILAVIVPSLVLAWLAIRSLRDQQFLLERQQALLYQGVTDDLARRAAQALLEYQNAFNNEVAGMLREHSPLELAKSFDDQLRQRWPPAQLGFAVTLNGEILSPSPLAGAEARVFCADNGRFLANRESAEVYLNSNLLLNNPVLGKEPQTELAQAENNTKPYSSYRNQQARAVVPQRFSLSQKLIGPDENQQQASKVAPSEAEFRQLIGQESQGTIARHVENKLNVLLWCRPPQDMSKSLAKGGTPAKSASDAELVFGAQLALPKLVEGLGPLLQQVDPAFQKELCLALLNDNAKPAALSYPGFHANWKRPFVASEIGEALPHWEIAAYLLNPAKLDQSARLLKLTFGLLICILVLAIGVGSWLIVTDLNRQLALARQKTDFVSNVSHELKTPLTSIRMFSELLAEGRVPDAARQRSFLQIITAETARLTRLINNVLDFARLERGENKYSFQTCDLAGLVRDAVETYRPELERAGFTMKCELPATTALINGDRDALAQVLLNLLSNAEKYSEAGKEIMVKLEPNPASVQVQVLDRGPGVPHGSEEKIFEKFYRAHDALSSGIQGSGLGLTLARQIARAHGGDILYEPRPGGGSCFTLRLPLAPPASPEAHREGTS
jgi:signal transduction histidine kinase